MIINKLLPKVIKEYFTYVNKCDVIKTSIQKLIANKYSSRPSDVIIAKIKDVNFRDKLLYASEIGFLAYKSNINININTEFISDNILLLKYELSKNQKLSDIYICDLSLLSKEDINKLKLILSI